MKPDKYYDAGSWHDYVVHYEVCARINGWSEQEKGLYLAVSLLGQAQTLVGTYDGPLDDYKRLKTILQERFAPPKQTELYRAQLKERRHKSLRDLD